MTQVVSIVGSMIILVAYIANQFGRIGPNDLSYVLPNFIGSVVLSVVAILDQLWGFLLLEGVWAVVSLWSLIKLLGGRSNPLPH